MLTNRTQSRVSISGLTYNNLLEDAYNAIKDSDEFKDAFTQFTSNTAERLIAELYAYMATQLATRMDQMGNELFVDTASSYGLSRLLKLVGAKVDFPAAASTDVTVSTSATTDTITFTTGIGTDQTGDDLVFLPGSFKSVTANNGTSWEFIEYKVGENGEYVYDYTTQYKFTAPSQTFTIHEGTTHSYDYTIRSVNTDIITLPNNSVIKDSVRVYYKQKGVKAGTTDAYEINEFKKVDNFFTTSALTATTGIYTIRNMGNGRCELCIKPYYNKDTTESDIGKELLIMYRTGGGADGNIAIGSITKTERFNTLGNNGTTVTGVGELTITNTEAGNGGKDELTTDEIRATVVNEVRNTKIAITEEDYEYLLPKYDSTISLLKCYGEKNEETADLAETYGYYANPIAVWLIILKYNKEFYDAYMNGESGLTDRINDIVFNVLDINPRFDEQYQVNTASINQIYKAGELDDYYTQDGWVYSLPINQQGVETLLSGDCEITVTNSPYVDSSVESRRGPGCFSRYNGAASEINYWNNASNASSSLMALTNVSEGSVYRVLNEDVDGGVNDRWQCIQAIGSTPIAAASYADYWKKVDFSYIFDNMVDPDGETAAARDIMYIQQTGDDIFTTEVSLLGSSFSASWSDLLEKYGSETIPGSIDLSGVVLVINGTYIDFSEEQSIFSSLEQLVEFINAKEASEVYYISLRDHIADLTSTDTTDTPANVTIASISNENFVAGTGNMKIKFGSLAEQTISITESDITTCGGLVGAINTAISANQVLNGKVKAVFNQNSNNECWDIWLIGSQSFTYKDLSTDGYSAIYRYMLGHPDFDGTLDATKYRVNDLTQINEWADYLFSDGLPIVAAENGRLTLLFDEDGDSSLQVLGNNANWMRILFGLSETDDTEHSRLNRRTVTVSLVTGDSPVAYLNIAMSSEGDKLNEDIYINIFGIENTDIKLGSYYENIEDNLPEGTPQVIIDLLKRGPIKALYSTSYDTSGADPVIDKYGCNYQLKFSTGLVEEQTYNELSSGNSPAYVVTTKADYDTLKSFTSSDKLYLRVDGVEYDGTGSFTLNGVEKIVPEYQGYAEFSLSWFNSETVNTLISAIVKTFEEQGENGNPLLDSVAIEGDLLRLYTLSAAYYSSLDFGKTPLSTVNYLFGINNVIVYSEEGQIDLKQISYSYYSFTSYPAVGKQMTLTYTPSTGAPVSSVIQVGYSMTNFQSNIVSSTVGQTGAAVFNNNRLILDDLDDGAKLKIELSWDGLSDKNAWEKMFAENTWNDFTITDVYTYELTSDTTVDDEKTYYERSGSSPDYVYTPVENPTGNPYSQGWYERTGYDHGSAVCEYVNDGDYYIDLTDGVYTLKIENSDKFPYGNIYVHMYEDYSYDHVVSNTGNVVTYTDEYNWNRLMIDRRVMLTEHIYKQPRFIPFDLAITCQLPNTEMWSQTDYTSELRQFLREEYGVYANNIGKEIRSDDIVLNIKNSFAKIRAVSVDYLGYEMSSEATNKLKLETKFNQQHILASDESSVEAIIDSSTGLINFETVVIHGLKLTFVYIPA